MDQYSCCHGSLQFYKKNLTCIAWTVTGQKKTILKVHGKKTNKL